jgi:hypothetical protein
MWSPQRTERHCGAGLVAFGATARELGLRLHRLPSAWLPTIPNSFQDRLGAVAELCRFNAPHLPRGEFSARTSANIKPLPGPWPGLAASARIRRLAWSHAARPQQAVMIFGNVDHDGWSV